MSIMSKCTLVASWIYHLLVQTVNNLVEIKHMLQDAHHIIFAGAARRAGPDSMLILCVCIWDNFSASDWSKIGDVARRRTT